MGYLGLSSLVSNEKLKSLTQISLHGLLQAFTLLLSGFIRTISYSLRHIEITKQNEKKNKKPKKNLAVRWQQRYNTPREKHLKTEPRNTLENWAKRFFTKKNHNQEVQNSQHLSVCPFDLQLTYREKISCLLLNGLYYRTRLNCWQCLNTLWKICSNKDLQFHCLKQKLSFVEI